MSNDVGATPFEPIFADEATCPELSLVHLHRRFVPVIVPVAAAVGSAACKALDDAIQYLRREFIAYRILEDGASAKPDPLS